jgi:KipI family sensor histidine kinase inhibitor
MKRCSFTDLRDGLVLVDFPGLSDDAANRAAVALARELGPLRARGLWDAVPAARTLLLSFDALRLTHAEVRRAVSRTRASDAAAVPTRTLEIPAVFDGPDLEEIAAAARLPTRAFVEAYAAAEYRVAFLGFSPGFAYLTGLPERLRTPRLPTPRLRVPAGSLAIGGAWTGIYPASTPGGWRLIGRTSVRLFDPSRTPPALFSSGDRVRFTAAASLEDVNRPVRSSDVSARPLFRVLRPGLWSAVVGPPRRGLAASGVPQGGPMDSRSAARANAAAGGPYDAAVLEMAVEGAELAALAAAVVAVAGAAMPLTCGGSPRPHGQPFAVAAGDRLTFGRAREGMHTYLAVGDGLREPDGVVTTRRLERQDVVFAAVPRRGGESGASSLLDEPEAAAAHPLGLRAIPGPHEAMFTPESVDAFFAGEWRVSPQSDRRGLRLEGRPLAHAGPAEVEPVGAAPGSVQVPGGGTPIVLGPDGPVTGGYPRIATVIGADLPLLGQAAPGETIRFIRSTLDEALTVNLRARAGRAAREYDGASDR